MAADSTTSRPGTMRRELGATGATLLGLGSILGTGVFVSIGVAAGVAGTAVIAAILLAAGLAACNALSSAQLAASHPVSGGSYEYGYRLLHPTIGFVAGWVFLCAKSASAAAAALGATGYLYHVLGIEPRGGLGAGAAILALLITALVAGGMRRSSRVNAAIVGLTLLALIMFAAFGVWHLASGSGRSLAPFLPEASRNGASAFFYATALMFVAYTGYARIATLGEEVRDPGRTIPQAIIMTLAISAALYVLVAVAALGALDAEALGTAATREAVPLEIAAQAMNAPLLVLVIALGAVSAMLGVLLNLLLGLSRVVLAMGRRGDLPPALAVIGPRGDPRRAVVSMGIIIAVMALPGQIETTWAFSALTVLIYYAITNAAALRLPQEQMRYPSVLAWLGLGGCLALTAFLPLRVWILGAVLIGGGLLWRVLAQRLWPG